MGRRLFEREKTVLQGTGTNLIYLLEISNKGDFLSTDSRLMNKSKINYCRKFSNNKQQSDILRYGTCSMNLSVVALNQFIHQVQKKLSVSLIKEYKQLCHFSNVFLCRFFFNNKGDYSINRVRVQVVACSKGYLHITVMLSKAYGPESQLPLPALGGGL